MKTADDATRGKGRTTMTSDESGWWTMQGNDNGGNNGTGDIVALAVTSAGIGWCNESGRGEEEDAVMAAEGYRQQPTKSGDGNGGCDGQQQQQSTKSGSKRNSGGRGIGRRQRWQNWRQQGQKLWWHWRQSLLAPVKGRGDCCSNRHCRVFAAAITISAASA
jgi:hypothetical protein